VPAPRRRAFSALVRELPGHWIANETLGALDGTPLAWTRPHGQSINWFG
jgi:hypothetical protein